MGGGQGDNEVSSLGGSLSNGEPEQRAKESEERGWEREREGRNKVVAERWAAEAEGQWSRAPHSSRPTKETRRCCLPRPAARMGQGPGDSVAAFFLFAEWIDFGDFPRMNVRAAVMGKSTRSCVGCHSVICSPFGASPCHLLHLILQPGMANFKVEWEGSGVMRSSVFLCLLVRIGSRHSPLLQPC